MILETSRVTTIKAAVAGQDPIKAFRPYHAKSDQLFLPEHVEIVVSGTVSKHEEQLQVKVSGSGLLKSGKPGQVATDAKFGTRGGSQYSSSLPLTDMPQWLAEFVDAATAGLLDGAE